MATTRAKFVCTAVQESDDGQQAQLEAVVDGSEENDKFFSYTPMGQLNIGTVHGNLFEEGKEYYLDFSPADTEAESSDGEAPQEDQGTA